MMIILLKNSYPDIFNRNKLKIIGLYQSEILIAALYCITKA